ncbi:MAG: hypothetical protein IIV48_06915 [Clostridium sp.]|nr:hypothetical protein [Clostridium sp.]
MRYYKSRSCRGYKYYGCKKVNNKKAMKNKESYNSNSMSISNDKEKYGSDNSMSNRISSWISKWTSKLSKKSNSYSNASKNNSKKYSKSYSRNSRDNSKSYSR